MFPPSPSKLHTLNQSNYGFWLRMRRGAPLAFFTQCFSCRWPCNCVLFFSHIAKSAAINWSILFFLKLYDTRVYALRSGKLPVRAVYQSRYHKGWVIIVLCNISPSKTSTYSTYSPDFFSFPEFPRLHFTSRTSTWQTNPPVFSYPLIFDFISPIEAILQSH